ncbi:unnamed protein product, partial [Prorocentrum cordatum]
GGAASHRFPVELELLLPRGLRVQLGEVRMAPEEDSVEKLFGYHEVSILLRLVPGSLCAGSCHTTGAAFLAPRKGVAPCAEAGRLPSRVSEGYLRARVRPSRGGHARLRTAAAVHRGDRRGHRWRHHVLLLLRGGPGPVPLLRRGHPR